jgi:integrase
MSSIYLLLHRVHDCVHDSPTEMNYSEPKIFTGGVVITAWKKLSKTEQKAALNKDWYVRYSFRNPKTGKLVRQVNIKAGANSFKDMPSRYHVLKIMKESLLIVLKEGFNPYKDSTTLIQYLETRLDGKETPKAKKEVQIAQKPEEDSLSIEKSFKLVLDTKKKVLNANSFVRFKSRVNRFEIWVLKNGFKKNDSIKSITKKNVIHYLNTVLQDSSPRNRNNSRTDLGSFFQTLMDNDVIQDNFVKQINVLKAVPERNKTYTPTQLTDIFDYLREHDPLLQLFVEFVSYNFLRPIEVCRLKIGDVDLIDKKIYVRAKNQPVKIKIIPEVLISEIPDLSNFDKDDYLFTQTGIGGKWDTEESNKRDYFTKQFKKVKDKLGLSINYGLYSFRHTFITKLYQEMAKTATPFEVKSRLQLITGHATMAALEQYLRDIDAVLPEDYSNLLK